MVKPEGKGGGSTDPRFAAMHSDPRFQRFPKQKNKVVVDKRFAGASVGGVRPSSSWAGRAVGGD